MQALQEVTTGTVAHGVDLDQLRIHIRTLITLEETEAPIVSCYVHHAVERDGSQPSLFDRVRTMRKVLGGQERDDFEAAFASIQRYLATELRPTTQGVAVFARAGTRPFFKGLQFQVPLPDRLSVSSSAPFGAVGWQQQDPPRRSMLCGAARPMSSSWPGHSSPDRGGVAVIAGGPARRLLRPNAVWNAIRDICNRRTSKK